MDGNTMQVTSENIEDVATWCDGHILTRDSDGNPKLFIKIDQYNIAFVGDYIVKGADGIDVFSKENYQSYPMKARRDPDKYSAILKLVKKAMREQDAATYNQSQRDMNAVSEDVAIQILELG